MAQWAWHAFPESKTDRYEDTLRNYTVHGRQVSYATDMRSETAQTIRANPHRFNLARIALRLLRRDKTRATIDDIHDVTQTVSLWSGGARSPFTFENRRVQVRTIVHPTFDAVATSIESPLAATGQIAVEVSFAFPAGVWGPQVDDWNRPERHQTTRADHEGQITLLRKLDGTRYQVGIHSNGTLRQEAVPHTYVIRKPTIGTLEVALQFARNGAPLNGSLISRKLKRSRLIPGHNSGRLAVQLTSRPVVIHDGANWSTALSYPSF